MIIMIDIILEWIYSNIKFMLIVILFVNNYGHNWWQWYDRGWCNNMIAINIVIIYLWGLGNIMVISLELIMIIIMLEGDGRHEILQW